MSRIESLGNFPVNGAEARKSGEFHKITMENALKVVSGRRNPVLLNFFCSNDYTNVGKMIIPSGGIQRQTEYDSHEGDAVMYVEKGPATFLTKADKETFQVEEGEYMFIPAGTEYKIINYTGHLLQVVFIVSPVL